jgi:hypothetical protein
LDFGNQEVAVQPKKILVRPVYVLFAQAIPFPDANVEFLVAIAAASGP